MPVAKKVAFLGVGEIDEIAHAELRHVCKVGHHRGWRHMPRRIYVGQTMEQLGCFLKVGGQWLRHKVVWLLDLHHHCLPGKVLHVQLHGLK